MRQRLDAHGLQDALAEVKVLGDVVTIDIGTAGDAWQWAQSGLSDLSPEPIIAMLMAAVDALAQQMVAGRPRFAKPWDTVR